MKTENIIAALTGHNGHNVTVHTARAMKPARGIVADIVKHSTFIVRGGVDYANTAANADRDGVLSIPAWAVWDVRPYTCKHAVTGKVYAVFNRASSEAQRENRSARYTVNGKDATREEVAALVPPSSMTSGGESTAFFTIAAESIVQIGK